MYAELAKGRDELASCVWLYQDQCHTAQSCIEGVAFALGSWSWWSVYPSLTLVVNDVHSSLFLTLHNISSPPSMALTSPLPIYPFQQTWLHLKRIIKGKQNICISPYLMPIAQAKAILAIMHLQRSYPTADSRFGFAHAIYSGWWRDGGQRRKE